MQLSTCRVCVKASMIDQELSLYTHDSLYVFPQRPLTLLTTPLITDSQDYSMIALLI